MTNQCGNVRLDFGAPVRLTDYINALEPCIDQGVVARSDSGLLNESPSLSRFSKPYISLGARVYSYAELHPQFDKAGADRAHIRAIGYHAIYESQTLSAISIPSVVTALLLCKYRRGTNLEN
uniref:Uncharacterized protein n=1 Tax=Plectus sambesii TaxID=2011161 RepID=A0A914V9R6_9BILA